MIERYSYQADASSGLAYAVPIYYRLGQKAAN